MSQPFVFPPPPPPPPRRTSTQDSSASSYSQSNRGPQRGRGDFRGNQSWRGSGQSGNGRGRGRGFGSGGSRGSQHTSPRPTNAVNTWGTHGQNQSREYPSAQSFSNHTNNQKRDHTSAFPSSGSTQNNRPRAPPAVPSFNMDIDNLLKKPENLNAPKHTFARKSNLLGLTPASYESEPESDGEDDEVKLANTVSGDTISFEHRGQKMSLSSPAEIAAWIAERRSKYPTKLKADAAKQEAEEKARQWEERKKANQEAARVRKEERDKERYEREKKTLREKLIAAQIQKSKAAIADAKTDPTEKALLKADRLRKRAERATQQLKEAEAALDKARARRRDLTQSSTDHTTNAASDPDGLAISADSPKIADPKLSGDSDMDSDTISSTDVEDTSSSGSSDSEEDVDSDSAPEEASSKLDGPERVPPPKRAMETSQSAVCRNLSKTGKCKFGKKCRYSHDVPSRKDTKAKSKLSSVPARRKGLYQIMVEKEHEDDHKRALRAIIALGDQGLLTSESTINQSNSE